MKKILLIAAIAALVSSCGEKYDRVALTDNLFIVNEHNAEPKLYGVQNSEGAEILPMQFSAITLEDDLLIATNAEGKTLHNLSGELLFGGESLTKDGAFWVDNRDDGSIRYYNTESDAIIGPYAKILKTPGQFIVYKDSILAGIVGFDGKEIIEPKYEELYIVQDENGSTAYIVFDNQAKGYQSYDADAQPVRPYTKKQFKRLQKGATNTWSHGFMVKKL